MKTAIVTGASGFIGGAVTRELLANGYHVYAITRGGGQSLATKKNCTKIICDLRDVDKLMKMIPRDKAQAFYHFAWDGASGQERGDAHMQLANAKMTSDCLYAANELGCRRFIFPGSIMEHETLASLHSQGGQPEEMWVYAGAKMAARGICLETASSLGLEPVFGTITNAYGPGERSTRMLNSAIRKLLRGETPVFTEGTQNYDFVYIDDAAKAFRMIGEKGVPFHDYVIGSGHARPLREFLLEMKAAIAPDTDFRFGSVPFKGRNLPLAAFDCAETEKDTGFKAQVSFGDGCRHTRDWLCGEMERGGDYAIS